MEVNSTAITPPPANATNNTSEKEEDPRFLDLISPLRIYGELADLKMREASLKGLRTNTEGEARVLHPLDLRARTGNVASRVWGPAT